MSVCQLLSALIILGPFAKLRKGTVKYVVSVRLSVRVKQLDFHLWDLSEIWYL